MAKKKKPSPPVKEPEKVPEGKICRRCKKSFSAEKDCEHCGAEN